MKQTLLCLIAALVLVVPFGCQKSGSDNSGKIGQRSSDQRVIVGTLNEDGVATFMSEETILEAYNSTYTPSIVAHEATISKVAPDQFQLKLVGTITRNNISFIQGFALELMYDEIVFATDQCMHACSASQSGCGCELTFSDCEGRCLCIDAADLHCKHTVYSGGPIVGVINSFLERLVAKS